VDDVIFIREGDDLIPLGVAPYEAEAALQELLEHHPQLLAGAQMNRTNPRRFLLVRREAPIADHDGGAGRWSIDHLFLDQDAIPTLVEVKRSTDTRIRREVVGQMLDYAANASRFWTPEQLDLLFQKTCQDAGVDSSEALTYVIGSDADEVDFWARGARNLRNGSMRLVFVADDVPDELRAVIEFLHLRMGNTEVYGVEVHRYASDDGKECYVPRLVGELVLAEERSTPSFDEMFIDAGTDIRAVRERLETWAGCAGLRTVAAPKSAQVHDSLGAVARIYPTYGTLELALDPIWNSNHQNDAQEIIDELQMICGKKLTKLSPNLPCREVLASWSNVVALLQRIVALRGALNQ